ncbi:Uncharacterised protein [Bordetella pertussis]|nr:Uncharacterised protein [Bordetella pertussis]
MPLSCMVGISGMRPSRCDPVTASARSLPACTMGTALRSLNISVSRPPSRSDLAGPPPRYGTCVILTCAVVLNSSPARCMVLPVPDEPKVAWPGCCLA